MHMKRIIRFKTHLIILLIGLLGLTACRPGDSAGATALPQTLRLPTSAREESPVSHRNGLYSQTAVSLAPANKKWPFPHRKSWPCSQKRQRWMHPPCKNQLSLKMPVAINSPIPSSSKLAIRKRKYKPVTGQNSLSSWPLCSLISRS